MVPQALGKPMKNEVLYLGWQHGGSLSSSLDLPEEAKGGELFLELKENNCLERATCQGPPWDIREETQLVAVTNRKGE